jgi:selenocysteine-specific elongation factor
LPQRHIVIGTAGHIDHGKTSLVKALTGIDADRLLEEKQRGITIDIGFAHMEAAPGVTLSFVDLPGHERFIKNMLAGVSGIDLVLFVIAADESIKPQTREHFDICRLLGIREGIVVLTKADLVDRDLVDLVRLETEEFVAGSFLAGAPVIAVSAATGAGISELQSAILALVSRIEAKDDSGYFRLPIDRSFSVKGFGAVVTGTLVSGAIARESEVELFPSARRLRVRGLHVHGKAVDRVVAGQRTAINLAGIEHSEIARGMVLSEPGRFRAVSTLDCSLELIEGAKIKARARVHFHAGAAEIQAEIRKLYGGGFARIILREPALILPGDRFILRGASPLTTIGGGVVIDINPPRYRRTENVEARLTALPLRRVATILKEARRAMPVSELIARTGLPQSALTDPEAVAVAPDLLVHREWLDTQRRNLETQVAEFHAANPLLPGVPKQSLRVEPALLDMLLQQSKLLTAAGDLIHLRTHKVVLQQEEQQARDAIERAFEEAGLSVPSVNEVLAKSGVEERRARSLLQSLLRDKRLVRIGADLIFHETAVASLRSAVSTRKGQRFSVATFKEWTGISRKYAIPLLEHLDRERLTRRDGDERVVL